VEPLEQPPAEQPASAHLDTILEAIATGSVSASQVFNVLPDLSLLKPPWLECGVAMYKLSASANILPWCTSAEQSSWVSPQSASIFTTPTPAFKHHAAALYDLYRETVNQHSICSNVIVQLPPHVENACLEHADMEVMEISDFLKSLMSRVLPLSKLTSGLIALAEYADKDPDLVSEWKREGISNKKWVPLVGGHVGGGDRYHVNPSEAFAPCCSNIEPFGLGVVQRHTADLHLYPPDGSAHELYSTDMDNTAVVRTMIAWGLKTDLTWTDVLEEGRDIAERGDVANAERLLDYLDQRKAHLQPPGEGVVEELKTIAFVPGSRPAPRGCAPQTSEPEGGGVGLFQIEELAAHDCHSVVWAVRPTSLARLWWIELPRASCRNVVEQIKTLASYEASVHVISHLLECVKIIAGVTQSGGNSWMFAELSAIAWVPSHVSVSMQLVLPSRVAQHVACIDLSPSFGRLPDNWRQLISGSFWDAMGVYECIGTETLIDELNSLKSGALAETELKLAIQLAMELGSRCNSDQQLKSSLLDSGKCYVPTKSKQLVLANEVFIDDASTEEAVELLHELISESVGRSLGCTSVRDELARRCEETGGFDYATGAETFGQAEKLSDRIKGLLRDYNGPADVLVEHWQNSDDAGAERILFCIDSTTYGTDNLVDDRAKTLQGPALVLASSHPLEEADIMAMQRLGASGKSDRFGTVGRFGVGLNCMYHIADAFTLLANDALHVFDPMQIAVTRGNETGKKYGYSKLKSLFPDMLEPFAHLCAEWPTVFRLPLRTISSAFGKSNSPKQIKTLLTTFFRESNASLLFSKHVRCVQFKSSNALLAQIERSCENTTMMQELPSTIAEVMALNTSPRTSLTNVAITTTMKDSSSKTSHWIVSHVLRFASVAHYKLCISRYNDMQTGTGISLLPHGASALLLDAPSDYRGKVCNYFPLSGWECGPPLLVHAQWDVHSSRKAIPLPSGTGSGKNDTERWNQAMIWGPVAISLAMLLEACGNIVQEGQQLRLSSFLDMLALENSDNAASLSLRDQLSTATTYQVMSQQLRVFPVAINHKKTPRVLDCVGSDEIYLRVPHYKLTESIQDLLAMDNLLLGHISERVCNIMKNYVPHAQYSLEPNRACPQVLSPEALCAFLREGSPVRRRDPKLELSPNVDVLLEFIVQKKEFDLRSLRGVPLLRVRSGQLLEFGSETSPPIFCDHAELLPHLPHRFIEASQTDILLPVDSSRDGCLQRSKAIGIRSLCVDDLLEHRSILHDTILLERPSDDGLKWCEVFWRLMWMKEKEKGRVLGAPQPLDQIGSWRVLQVWPADGGHALIPLDESPSVFMLRGVDRDWQQAIAEVILQLGFHILAKGPSNNANQSELLQSRVQSGDIGLCNLIARACEENNLSTLSIKHRKDLLEYFASRKNLSSSIISNIKAMPLFLLAEKQSNDTPYTSLHDARLTYVAMRKDSGYATDHVGNLTRLPISGLVHLALPTLKSTSLYGELGVHMISSSDFVQTHVCPFLPEAAQGDYDTVLRPILEELASWVVKSPSPEITNPLPQDHIVDKIVHAARSESFVHTVTNDVVAPC
jgi:hypothetical protein